MYSMYGECAHEQHVRRTLTLTHTVTAYSVSQNVVHVCILICATRRKPCRKTVYPHLTQVVPCLPWRINDAMIIWCYVAACVHTVAISSVSLPAMILAPVTSVYRHVLWWLWTLHLTVHPHQLQRAPSHRLLFLCLGWSVSFTCRSRQYCYISSYI